MIDNHFDTILLGEEYRFYTSHFLTRNRIISFGVIKPGEEITVNHTWSEKGKYEIRIRAKDTDGLRGAIGSLAVAMPKNQQVSNMWYLRWLERFPRVFPILRWLLELK